MCRQVIAITVVRKIHWLIRQIESIHEVIWYFMIKITLKIQITCFTCKNTSLSYIYINNTQNRQFIKKNNNNNNNKQTTKHQWTKCEKYSTQCRHKLLQMFVFVSLITHLNEWPRDSQPYLKSTCACNFL